MNALTRLLGVRFPIVQGPFGGGYSTVRLAAAVSEAGGLGSFGAHILNPSQITGLVGELRKATSRPFAVNLWVPQEGEPSDFTPQDVARLQPYYDRLGIAAPSEPYRGPTFDDQVRALLEAAPPVISFVMGLPPSDVMTEARQRGIITIGTATTLEEAVALEKAGLDAVVASGSDAGGHRGSWLRPVTESLVGTFSLVPQIADAVGIPVIAAGGIADSRGVRAALALGADGVQVGTGFLATDESGASQIHKEALPAAQSTILTRLFSGRPARAIPNRFTREMADHESSVPGYPVQNALMLPIRRASGAAADPDHVNLWSGQAGSLVRSRPAADYLAELTAGLD